MAKLTPSVKKTNTPSKPVDVDEDTIVADDVPVQEETATVADQAEDMVRISVFTEISLLTALIISRTLDHYLALLRPLWLDFPSPLRSGCLPDPTPAAAPHGGHLRANNDADPKLLGARPGAVPFCIFDRFRDLQSLLPVHQQ